MSLHGNFGKFGTYLQAVILESIQTVAAETFAAVLSAQAARSFEVWDGTRPPSVGGLPC